MADIQAAKRAYATIIAMMDGDNLKYSRDDDNLRIELGFNTDDLDVNIKFTELKTCLQPLSRRVLRT